MGIQNFKRRTKEMNENSQIQELREQLHAYSKERLVELCIKLMREQEERYNNNTGRFKSHQSSYLNN